MRAGFTDHLRVLYKRRWIAVSAFLVVFLYAAVSTLRTTPLYEAKTQLRIEKESAAATTDQGPLKDDTFYQTQLRLMQSRAIAWRTLTSLGQSQPPSDAVRRAIAEEDARRARGGWLERVAVALGAPSAIPPASANETGWQSARIDSFLAGVTVAPVPFTRLVEIRFRSADPTFAARAADAMTDAFVAQGLQYRALTSQGARRLLADQISTQKQKLADSEQALQSFKKDHNIVDSVAPENTAAAQQLAEISAELTQARSDRLEKEQLHLALKQDAAPLTPLPDRFVESIDHDYQAAKERERALDEQLRALKTDAVANSAAQSPHLALERAVISDRQVYDDLMHRARLTGVSGDYAAAIVQVIDTAEVPRLPVLPNRPRDLGIGLVAGLLLALGLAFGIDYVDSRIKSPDDIKNHLGLPFLGLVPAVKRKQIKGPSPLVQRGAPSPFAESLRGLRTAVVFSAAGDGPRSIMVTSTAPSEGKTVIACNLGDVLAQAEQRTIVIDGDMRRPRVHEIFQIAQEPGLSNVLAGTLPLSAAIRQTQNPFLHVLPAGLIPPNPAELLGSQKYLQLLEELGQTYDWVVIDAPPVMAVTDAAIISGSAGGVVFVVGAEMTPRRNAQIALEQLVGVRAKLVGAVLNRAKVDRHAFYYSQYYRKDYTQAYVRTP